MTTATTTPAPTTNHRFVSIWLKMLVAFTLAISIVLAGAYYWFYNFSSQVAETQIRADLTNTMVAAVAGVNGDDLEALINDAERNADGYTDDPRFWAQATWLNAVHKIEPRAFIYTYYITPEEEIFYIASMGAVWNPPAGAQFKDQGTLRADQGNPQLLGLAGETYSAEIYSDDYGNWISGYTPVRNSQGEVVGGLGVDFTAEYVLDVRTRILNGILWSAAIAYAIILVSISVVARRISRPIEQLTVMAKQVGEGNYEQDFAHVSTGALHDEINTLAEVFAGMVEKVHKREVTLKQEVIQLRIEINEALKEKQVKEIEETEFFQDLQTKASDMRRRHRGRQQPTEVGESGQ
ncbi:MAG: HAMP domain-containing protein [Chloroflexi bacterium]|nr:HAMP domain-containing protein [Chloroflexota bacterium]